MAAQSRSQWLAAFAAASMLGTHPAPARSAQAASATDLCVVRVEDTAATGSVEAGQPYRYLSSSYSFPGSPFIALNPLNRSGLWTLSDDRRYVRMTEGTPPRDPDFPTASMQNDFAVEAHSGRVLGITSGRGVWALTPGGERFAAHRPDQWTELGFLRTRTMAYVPGWRATVFGGAEGLFIARDDEPIAPVLGPNNRPLGDVTRAVAVPGRGAAVIGTIDGRVGLVEGEHGPSRVQWLFSYPPITERGSYQGQGSDYVSDVLPLPRSGEFLVRGGHHAHLLKLPSSVGATADATTEEVERAPRGPPFTGYRQLAPDTGEYLAYVPVTQRERLPSEAGLFRLESNRFVPVPGGDAAALGLQARFFAVPSRGLVVVRAQDGRLFVYRDGALAQVPGSGGVGPLSAVRDLRSVRRVLVQSSRGAFELTHDLRLVPVLAPVTSLWVTAVVEMPPSGIAAVIAREGVFALGPEGDLVPVRGGEAARSRVVHRIFLPSRSELLFTGDEGLFLLLDRRLSGADACTQPSP